MAPKHRETKTLQFFISGVPFDQMKVSRKKGAQYHKRSFAIIQKTHQSHMTNKITKEATLQAQKTSF